MLIICGIDEAGRGALAAPSCSRCMICRPSRPGAATLSMARLTLELRDA